MSLVGLVLLGVRPVICLLFPLFEQLIDCILLLQDLAWSLFNHHTLIPFALQGVVILNHH